MKTLAMTEQDQAVRILRYSEVAHRLGVTRRTIRQWVQLGLFPKPVRIGTGVKPVGFVEDEVDAYLAKRIAERDTEAMA